jgi:CRP/FNR family transcriptional regulator
LKTRGFLARLPEPLADALVDSAQLIEYPVGSVTFRRDEHSRAAVVVAGLLRIYLSASDGRQITLRYVREGDLVGPVRMLGLNVSSGTQAVERSTLLHLDPVQMESLAHTEPALAYAMVEELAERLSQTNRSLAMRAFATVKWRVARDLFDRALASGSVTPGMRLRVTHQDLADATGSVRDVVARVTRELRREGIIESDPAGLTIVDLDRLLLEGGLGA